MARIDGNLSRIHLLRSSGAVVFGDVTYGPAGGHGPRVQADYQIVLLYSGHADVFLDEESTPLHIAPGHAALLRPGRRECFRFTPDRPTHHGWCAVSTDLVDATLSAEIARLPPVVPCSSSLAAVVRLGLAVRAPRSETGTRLITQLGQTALLEFLAAAEDIAPVLPVALQRACEYIDTRYADPLDLTSLARVACVTPTHLIRLFSTHLGITPMRSLWRARVEAAVRLLGETGLSIAEIADRTGFQSPFHLSRLVKRSCDLSPRDLRRRVWNTPPNAASRD